jgi:transcriptional regulator with XRE-family HTH domain
MKKNTSKDSEDRPIAKSFGQVLQQLRRDHGLSQEELGFASGYHRTYISLLERGRKSPSLRTIFELAKAFKVNPSEIVERVQSLATYHSKNKHKIN